MTKRFNSRARMGRDPKHAITSGDNTGFNSRARMGRDKAFRCGLLHSYMFQLTRPHGARSADMQTVKPIRVSTHAPAWGAICLFVLLLRSSGQFQLTRPHGARYEED